MTLRPVQSTVVARASRNLKDLASAQIRHEIFSGTLRANQKIDQDTLAAALGISKLPVREALIGLEGEGLVINIPRRGAFVAALTPEDIRDHYTLIGLVSGLAAERAGEHMSDAQLEQLESILAELDREKDPERQDELNLMFHRAVNTASTSRRLRSALRLLTSTMPTHFYEFASGWGDRARQEHHLILAALRAHNPRGAGSAMSDHIASGDEFALKRLETSGFWDLHEDPSQQQIPDDLDQDY